MIGIFGGSFDPPHLGHLQIIQNYLEKYKSKLYIVPNYISPFKSKKGADSEHILRMLQILIDEYNLKDVIIYEEEIKKKGISYTFETILDFKSKFPKEELSLLIGEDNLAGLSKWKNIDLIFQNVDLLIYLRPGSKTSQIPEDLKKNQSKIKFQENPLHTASSSEFRELKKDSIVSRKVLEYIKGYHLYEYSTL